MDSVQRSGSSRYRSQGGDMNFLDKDEESHHGESGKPAGAKPEIVRGGSRELEASPSSSSSWDDLFEVDTSKVNTTLPRNAIHQEAQPEKPEVDPSDLQEADNGSGSPSTSQPHQAGTQDHGLLPTLNPPIQVMDRSGGYDPNRIPASVFAASPVTPMDWSLASNDSLFSINLGKDSLPRDSKFSFDFFEKPEELMILEEVTTPDETSLYSPTFQVQLVEDDEEENGKMGNEFGRAEPTKRREVNPKTSGGTGNSSDLASRSDTSENSGRSFAFPILTKEVKNGSSSESPLKTPSFSSSGDRRCCTCCCCSCYCRYSPSCPSCSCLCFPHPSCSSCSSCACRDWCSFSRSISCFHCC